MNMDTIRTAMTDLIENLWRHICFINIHSIIMNLKNNWSIYLKWLWPKESSSKFKLAVIVIKSAIWTLGSKTIVMTTRLNFSKISSGLNCSTSTNMLFNISVASCIRMAASESFNDTVNCFNFFIWYIVRNKFKLKWEVSWLISLKFKY